MCYLPPGPRCSYHAAQELNRALVAVAHENDMSRRLFLQLKADEALQNYYATPRGQNDLRRRIGVLSGNSSPEAKAELNDLRRKQILGAETRKAQLNAYATSVAGRRSAVKSELPNRNKNDAVTAITYDAVLGVLDENAWDAHIERPNVINVVSESSKFSILCLPEKLQETWGLLKTGEDGELFLDQVYEDVNMSSLIKLLTTNLTWNMLSPEQASIAASWAEAYFAEQGIKFVSVVDRRTEQLLIIPIEDLFEYYAIGFKLSKRLGGTTDYKKDPTILKGTLEGTVFASGEVIQVKNERDTVQYTILTNVPQQPKDLCSVPPFFLSWQESGNEPYYRVKSQHVTSSSWDVKAVLQRVERTTIGITDMDSLFSALARDNSAATS